MAQGTQMTIRSVLCDAPKFAQAICATIEDKDFFFPDGRIDEAERLPELKALCASCIHRKECLEYAIGNEILYGIWGGTTPREREKVLHPRRIPVGEMANRILDLQDRDVRKILTRFPSATRKGVNQSHQETKDDSLQSSESLS
jgi:WhiB family transcriptional regulator, redox-sensing transcriptional regulator